MKYAVILLVVLMGAYMAYHFLKNPTPLVGLSRVSGQEVLSSSARPALVFMPHEKAILTSAAWMSVRPKDSRLNSESVRLSLAVYDLNLKDTEAGKRGGRLVTAIAECPGEWEWVAAHHSPYPTLREVDEPYGNERLYESIYLLEGRRDPFFFGASGELSLVYRAKFLPFFRRSQVLFEYRECITSHDSSLIDLKPEITRSFAERGRNSCRLLFGAEAKVQAPTALSRGGKFSRDLLGIWLGEIKHPGANR